MAMVSIWLVNYYIELMIIFVVCLVFMRLFDYLLIIPSSVISTLDIRDLKEWAKCSPLCEMSFL